MTAKSWLNCWFTVSGNLLISVCSAFVRLYGVVFRAVCEIGYLIIVSKSINDGFSELLASCRLNMWRSIQKFGGAVMGRLWEIFNSE
jgi:hypothetical protein